MSHDKNFKRASLRGRGWKILRGVDQPTDEFAESEASPEAPAQLTSAEIDELLAVTPPSLGMLPPLEAVPSIATDTPTPVEAAFPVSSDDTEPHPPHTVSMDTSLPGFSPIPPAPDDLAPDIDTDEWSLEDPEVATSRPSEQFDFELPDLYLPLAPMSPDTIVITRDELANLLPEDDIFPVSPVVPSQWTLDDLEGRVEDTRPLTFDSGLDLPDLEILSDELSDGAPTLTPAEPVESAEIDSFVSLVADTFSTEQTGVWEPEELDEVGDALYDDLSMGIELPVIATPNEEAVPIAEPTDKLVTPIGLSGYTRQNDPAVATLIPNMPEIPAQELDDDHEPELVTVATSEGSWPSVALSASEGVGIASPAFAPPAIPTYPESTSIEGIPLVEDIDRPQPVNLKGISRITQPRDLIPRFPETRVTDRGPDIVIAPGSDSGGILAAGATTSQTTDDLQSPFDKTTQRLLARDLFLQTQEADDALLDKFVDEERLEQLWNLIEQLQEEVAEMTFPERTRTDTYQQELLYASELLLHSRQNYDDARAIAYRIRADLKRERRIERDIRQSRWILGYIICWAIALVTLWWLRDLFVSIAENLNVPFVGAGFLPSIAGAFGGLFLALSTYNKHTAVRRDFDSIHAPWYFLTPMVGSLMGFFTHLLWLAALLTQDSNSFNDVDSTSVLVILAAFLAGMQQNWLLRRLRALMRGTFGDDENSRSQSGNR